MPSMTSDEIGKIVSERRAALGLTVREAATRCGVSPAMIGFVEHGQVNARPATLQRILDGLGIEAIATMDVAPRPRHELAERLDRLLPRMAQADVDALVHLIALFESRYP